MIKMNTNSLSRKESKKLKKIRETKERQKTKEELKKAPARKGSNE